MKLAFSGNEVNSYNIRKALNISFGLFKLCTVSFMLNNMYTLLFQNLSFQALLPVVRQHIIDGFTPKALDVFKREFDFFDKVTSISGVLFPLPKEEHRAGIRRYAYYLLNF